MTSYIVTFEVGKNAMRRWRVDTDEGLDAFCKVLRLNGICSYSVTGRVVGGGGGGG